MFTFKVLPRLSETDGLGHINNTVLPVWFEEARRDLFKLFNPDLSLNEWNLILKKYEVEILNQIKHDEFVKITTFVEHIGNSSFVVLQKAEQNGKQVAEAKTVLIYFDYKTQSTAIIPNEIKEKLQSHIL